jgi:hypothetical protein
MKKVKYILGNVFNDVITGALVVFIKQGEACVHVWNTVTNSEKRVNSFDLIPVYTDSGKQKRAITKIPKNLLPIEAIKPKPVDDVQRELDKFTKAVMGKTGVSNWLSVEDGKFKQYVDRICHAGIAYNGIVISRHWEPVVHKYAMMRVERKERYKRWFDYVINRSPWKHVFITKDFDTALKSHVEIDVNVINYQVMGGITALRMGHEFPDIVKAYCQFLDDGFNEHDAFAMAGFLDNVYSLKFMTEGHTVFKNTHCIKGMFSFMHNGYAKPRAVDLPFKTHRRVGWSFEIQSNIAKDVHHKTRDVPFITQDKKDGWSYVNKCNKKRLIEYIQNQEWKSND